jgi:hypothetical protein
MDSPNPVPLPTGLVVKKGSNNRCFTFKGIPEPLSAMRITTCLLSINSVRIRISGEFGVEEGKLQLNPELQI